MALNSILASHPAVTAAEGAPARARGISPRIATSSTPAFRAPARTPVSTPAADDVSVQWDKDSGVVLRFTDKRSGQVLLQIPSEQMLSVAKFVRQLLQQEAATASAGKSR